MKRNDLVIKGIVMATWVRPRLLPDCCFITLLDFSGEKIEKKIERC
ncbi:hypothetical protein [Photorhabdus australis]|nr:hypothetical protein [Photorhabdus australis]